MWRTRKIFNVDLAVGKTKRCGAFPRGFLIVGLLACWGAAQEKPVIAPTGDPELVETAGTNFAVTEEDYLALARQFAGRSYFVPMTKKPDGLSPRARFGINFILEGKNRAWILDGDDAEGYVFYADFNGNGDLSDDPRREFELSGGKYSLRLWLAARSEDGKETYPVVMKIVVDRATPPGKTDKQLALLMYFSTRRRGQFFPGPGGAPLPFVITGSYGTYNEDHNWIYFDLDRDGRFDREVEGYQISERFVNIGDVTYEFAVDRYGRSVTLTPQAVKRPGRAVLLPGYPAPEFDFVDLQGGRRRFAEYRGKVVLLDFWGTWCRPCLVAVPKLVAVYEMYHARGLEIVGIANGDTRENLLTFTSEKRMKWTQTVESDRGPIATLYRVAGWPSYFLIGRDGRFVAVAANGNQIDLGAELAKLFPEKSPSSAGPRQAGPSEGATLR